MADTLTDADVAALAGQAKAPSGVLTDADVAAMAAKPEQSYEAGLLRTLIGQGTLLGWGDEIMGRLRQLAGEDYEAARNDERAKVSAFKKENPKIALGAEIGGSLLTPGLGLLGGAMKPAATVLGKTWQGAKLGAAYGGLSGAGAAETDTLQGAKDGALVGSVLGGGVGAIGATIANAVTKTADATAPTLARAGAKLTGVNPEEAATDATLKSWMRKSGDSPEKLRAFFAEAEQAGRFNANSKVEIPVVMADASAGMQKLAGSVVRGNPEAAKVGEAVLSARQTGVTPKGDLVKIVEHAGIPTRNPLSEVAERAEPVGQAQRLTRALKKSFLIDDPKAHGFETTAYKTEQAIISHQKEQATKLFPEAYANAQPFDLSPAFKSLASIMEDRTGPHLAVLQRAMRLFVDPKTGAPLSAADQLKRFQSGKEMLDDVIEPLIRGSSPKPKLARDLTIFRQELTNAVRGSNPKYAEALDSFTTDARMRDAMKLGREAFRENSEVAVEQLAALPKGERKVALYSFVDEADRAAGNKQRSHDVAKIFETPRIQAILREVIPRSEDAGAVFANRPERFGEMVGFEKIMNTTKNKVFGNSMTAERLADDARLGRATIGEMFDRYRSSPSLFAIGMEVVSAGLNRVFGFRDDVAKELARRLFTADRAQREAILARIEQTWGSDKIGALNRWMAMITEATSASVPASTGLMIGQNKK